MHPGAEEAEWRRLDRARRRPGDELSVWRAGAALLYTGLLSLSLLVPTASEDRAVRLFFHLLLFLLTVVLPNFVPFDEGEEPGDLGPRDDDMTEVRVVLRGFEGELGRDRGYLWADGRDVCFHGRRTSFRVPDADLDRFGNGRTSNAVTVASTRVGDGTLPVSASSSARSGPYTLPPSTRDPELLPPDPSRLRRILPIFAAPLAVSLIHFLFEPASRFDSGLAVVAVVLLAAAGGYALRREEAEVALWQHSLVPSAFPPEAAALRSVARD